ncbi:hypothetical protein [Siccirubricoccus phaeus]|uniref:hypothetical protein n=1 Tax=Siccirubricoccus phaeus TaxID=2595053 RepID=UPI0011F14AFE|nr:hypothetical protein [Siccirubricoccus phaeus]
MELLQDMATRLAVPGMPEWTGLLALLLLLLMGLAFLLMPFSVFGVKGRLEQIEAQLDEIQAELRGLSLRLSDAPRRAMADDWVEMPGHGLRVPEDSLPRTAPPVPPPAAWPEGGRASRAEPRLDWPRR